VSPRLFGVVGWKNSGKTTLMANLVRELARRGLAVSVIKHAHERFDIDHPGRDSFKLREAGAQQIALSSPRRFALMRELRNEPELPLEDVRAYIAPCDLVLVEGFKCQEFPKIETRRNGASSREPLYGTFPEIVAIASDRPGTEDGSLPTFHLDDTRGIADFIIAHLGLKQA
jgi:molybdopterin-guanine dinucleotide biosynthesis protein B